MIRLWDERRLERRSEEASLQQALALAFDVSHESVGDDLALNTPYLGAFECQAVGRQLRHLEPQGIVRHRSQEKVLRIRTGAYQAEFLRETLLGARNTAYVRNPGTDWPAPDVENLADLATRLTRAYDVLRRWAYDVPPTRAFEQPRFR